MQIYYGANDQCLMKIMGMVFILSEVGGMVGDTDVADPSSPREAFV